jgi:hypothetical protein
MSEKKFQTGNRAFLNNKGFHTDASVSYSLEVTGGSYCHFDGDIRFRDCDKVVMLELNGHSEKWMENSERKIDTIIDMLREAKRELRKARKVYVQEEKKKNAKKANSKSTSTG